MKSVNYRAIQALRGVAASAVVIYHAAGLWSQNAGHPKFWENGAAGVDLFFVISGFVMALISESSPGMFMKRRIIRVVPLYWVMTTLMLIKIAASHAHPSLAHGDYLAIPPAYIAASYLLIPYRNSVGVVAPLLLVGWTLSYEMFFYAWIYAAMALKTNVLRLLTPIFVGLSILGLFITAPAIMTLASPMLLEFLGGLWLGRAAKNGAVFNKRISIAAGAAGLAALLSILLPSPNARPFTWGVAAFLIVFSAVGLEPYLRLPNWTQALGDVSYSLYLVHPLMLPICYRILLRSGAFSAVHGEVITCLVCLAVTIPAAAFVHRLIEIPLTAAVKRWMIPRIFAPVLVRPL